MRSLFIQRSLTLSLFLLCWSGAQAGSTLDDQLAAIKELGQLNAVALHCNALNEVQRIKQGLVTNLPKQRQLGELFEHETNKAFMAFIEENKPCPSPAGLEDQIGTALDHLKAAYTSD